MPKAGIFLTVVGALIVIGLILSFYGSQIITEELISEQKNLVPRDGFTIEAVLDPEISETGVYVVQTVNFRENSIFVRVIDPFKNQLNSKWIDKESFEDRFEILNSGTYQLVVENLGPEETNVIGVIGHMPEKSKLSVGITGLYILIVGLIGMVGMVIYSIRNRRKSKF